MTTAHGTRSDHLWWALAVTVLVAIGQFADMDRTFYVMLRFVVLAAAGMNAIVAITTKNQVLGAALVVIAVLFNPIVQIHFGSKEAWRVPDLAAVVFTWIAWFTLYPAEPKVK